MHAAGREPIPRTPAGRQQKNRRATEICRGRFHHWLRVVQVTRVLERRLKASTPAFGNQSAWLISPPIPHPHPPVNPQFFVRRYPLAHASHPEFSGTNGPARRTPSRAPADASCRSTDPARSSSCKITVPGGHKMQPLRRAHWRISTRCCDREFDAEVLCTRAPEQNRSLSGKKRDVPGRGMHAPEQNIAAPVRNTPCSGAKRDAELLRMRALKQNHDAPGQNMPFSGRKRHAQLRCMHAPERRMRPRGQVRRVLGATSAVLRRLRSANSRIRSTFSRRLCRQVSSPAVRGDVPVSR